MTQPRTAEPRGFFRIDRFTVPAAGRDELLRRLEETREVLRAQPGYVRDYILERTNSNEGIGLLTFVEWDATARVESVRDAVRARHAQRNFDPNEMYRRLNVETDIGTYRATDAAPSQAVGTYENDPSDELPVDDARDDASLKRATVRRHYKGEIIGSSIAHVMIHRATPDRLGYIAVDRFDGEVGGRTGSFVFQHGGSIDRGVLRPFGYVVPGSGTGELAGIVGDVEIAFIPPATHTITLTYRFEP